MKKFIIGALALTMGVMMYSCGDAEDVEALEKEADEMLDEMKSETEPEAAEPIEISAEMADFVSGFDGTAEAVMNGLETYGATEEIVDNDMGYYNLKDPKITGKDGDCYELTCTSGAVENYYTICWTDGKITSIKETM